jgi:hypothetical protein
LTVTITPTVTPTNTTTPTITPTNSVTPSLTPTFTPTISPTITPTPTPSPSLQCPTYQIQILELYPLNNIFEYYYNRCEDGQLVYNKAFEAPLVCQFNAILGSFQIAAEYTGYTLTTI